MTSRIERRVPSENLHPGKIPRWHMRLASRFCLQKQTNKELEALREYYRKQMGARKARLVVSDMGEVVAIFEERKSKTPKSLKQTP